MLLSTRRLTIRHYTQNDHDDFNTILTNNSIMKGIRGKGHDIKTATEKFHEALQVNVKHHDLGYFNITLNTTQMLVGFAKLVLMNDGNLEVGYALVKELWGFGYATEITAALVEHGRRTYPEKEIIGIVNIDNDASKNVLLKQQFLLKNTIVIDGFEVAYFYLSK